MTSAHRSGGFNLRRSGRLSRVARERELRRQLQAAAVRSSAAVVIWLAAAAATWFDVLTVQSFVGISVSAVCLVLLNAPSLWVLKRSRTRGRLRAVSLAIHCLEIIGYTAIIHFSGGIEASTLTLIYAALIAYVGASSSRSQPFVVAGLSSVAFAFMVTAEHFGWLAHHSLLEAPPLPWRAQILVTSVAIGLLFVVASLTARASGQLWRSRARLRESESQFRTLVEHVPGLVYLAVPSSDPETSSREILFLGGRVEDLTGRSSSELVAERGTLLDLTHPDDRSGVGAKIDLAILDRTDYVVDYRLQHADGHWHWVEERGQGVYDDKGELLFVEAIVLGISERKSLEKETTLRRAVEQVAHEWQLTFDTVEAPMFILDSRGRIKRLNRAARNLSGRTFEQCHGRLLREVRKDEPWLAAEELVDEIVAARRSGTRHRMTSSGSRDWQLTATLSPRFAEERIVLIMQDATRVVELEESLRRGEKLAAMGTLVGGVAHEVRNPLFGVSATLDAMKAGFGDDEDLRPYLKGLRSQVDRMTDLMNGLLEYGRSAGVERSSVRLEEVISKAVADVRGYARELRVEVVEDLDLGDLELPLNREGLATLFSNLLSNALQHAPPGSRVRIEARCGAEGEERWAECVVTDCGSGFNGEALTRACEPFFSRRAGGMGLGLAIVERIVEDHGGKLAIANRREGGAKVTVRLPVGEADDVDRPAPSQRIRVGELS